MASVEYRLSGEARFPAQLEDVENAARYLAEHRGDFGISTDARVCWGASAGGHLAALHALTTSLSMSAGRPADLVALPADIDVAAEAPFAQFGQHGGVVGAQVLADSRQGPAEVAEVDGIVDLVGREAAAAHRHAVPMENVAHRSPFDAEPITGFVHRRAGLTVGDQLSDLIAGELPSAPGPLVTGC